MLKNFWREKPKFTTKPSSNSTQLLLQDELKLDMAQNKELAAQIGEALTLLYWLEMAA